MATGSKSLRESLVSRASDIGPKNTGPVFYAAVVVVVFMLLNVAALVWLVVDHERDRAALNPCKNNRLLQTDLSGCDLSNANLRGAPWAEVNLAGANLNNADLRDADLSNANLAGVDLTAADLNRAVLTGANLTGADLTRANLGGAELADAIVDDVVWVSTTCPSGTTKSGPC